MLMLKFLLERVPVSSSIARVPEEISVLRGGAGSCARLPVDALSLC